MFCDFFSCTVCDEAKSNDEVTLDTHVGIAHTRWATHGCPSETNSHPQRSDSEHSFVVVHNGIITNYKDVKGFLESKGHRFESETDTEVIAKLVYHLYEQHPNYSFRELVEQVIQQLVRTTAGFFFSLGRKSVSVSVKERKRARINAILDFEQENQK